MKLFNRRTAIRLFAVLTALITLSAGFTASAATVGADDVPYQSYTYWDNGKKSILVNSKDMYRVSSTITSSKLGIAPFSQITDMCIGPDGYIYITDSDAHKLTVIGSDRKTISEITNFSYNGQVLTLAKASGVFVSDNNDIYICDSDAGLILITDINGNVSRIISAPNSDILPEEFTYRPLKVAVDPDGYTYVLSDGSYYGALSFAPDGEFVGFYGANSVKGGIAQALKNLWNKLTMTNEKRKNSVKSLPYVFTDICIDDGGFVYTATGITQKDLQKGTIRRLSPGGINILRSDDVVFGETVIARKSDGSSLPQDLSGLAVDKDGYMFTYDRVLGNVYMYDSECTLVTAFGGGVGFGSQDGTFQLPCAIDIYGDDIYICDSNSQKITVFSPTEYGTLVRGLQKQTLDGDYANTTQGWQEVLRQDKNCQLAYVGLGKAAILEKDYQTALDYARIGDDRDTYAQAYEYMRVKYLSDNFPLIFTVVILVIAAAVTLLILKKKKHVVLVKNREVSLALSASIHPARVFREIQEKNRGSVTIGIVLLVLFYISEIIRNDCSGFLFSSSDVSAFNSIVVLVRTVGAVVIWTVANWAVSTLFGGRGKIKQIFIVTSYSITVMIIANLVYTLLSNFLVPSEASFMSLFLTLAQLFMVVILTIGTIIIHDFSFGRFIGTTILSIIGLLIIVFMIAATIVLVQQVGAFFITLLYEVIFR